MVTITSVAERSETGLQTMQITETHLDRGGTRSLVLVTVIKNANNNAQKHETDSVVDNKWHL